MTSGKNVNFDVVQGETFELQIAYTDENKNPIDLTGMDVVYYVTSGPEGDLCASGSLGSGVYISDPESGIINITMYPTQTKKFTLPRAYYEVKVIDNAQEFTDSLCVGWLKVSPGAMK